MSEFIFSTKQVAEFFEVHERTIQLWNKLGCPKYAHGKWNLHKVFRWWLDNIWSDERVIEDADTVLQAAKRDYWRAKADMQQLQVEKERGTVIHQADVKSQWVARLVEVMSGLNALKNRIPPMLEGLDAMQMREIIDQEIWSLRDKYARVGKFCEVVEPIIEKCFECLNQQSNGSKKS